MAVVETAPMGGLLHYAAQLADGLANRGHEVHLIAPRGHELEGKLGAATDLAVLTPPVASTESPKGGLRLLIKRAGVAVRLSLAWIEILARVLRGRYDAVIVNASYDVWISAGGLTALALLPGRTAVAHVCHNVRIFNRWAGNRRFRGPRLVDRLTKLAHRSVDLTFVHGERSQREFAEHWKTGAPTIIPHGDERIFADQAPPPSAEENVLFFGHWNRVKGIPLLQEAFDILAERRPDATLTMAGTPNDQEIDVPGIRRWADAYSGRVELIDRYVPMEEVEGIFARARVVVTPYFAGYQSGIVHLAMTLARPVVATDVGDLAEAVADGATGIVVPPENPEALASALERVLSDPELAARLGSAGRDRVMSGSAWEEVATQVEQSLEPLLRP